MDLAILIIISSIAYRGACSIAYNNLTGSGFLYNPMWTTVPSGRKFVAIYMFAAIPIGCLNGLLLYGWVGLIIAGISIYVGMLIVNLLLRFNPGTQFHVCGLINIVWTFINLLTQTI